MAVSHILLFGPTTSKGEEQKKPVKFLFPAVPCLRVLWSPVSPDSLVGIATRYGLDGPGIESQ